MVMHGFDPEERGGWDPITGAGLPPDILAAVTAGRQELGLIPLPGEAPTPPPSGGVVLAGLPAVALTPWILNLLRMGRPWLMANMPWLLPLLGGFGAGLLMDGGGGGGQTFVDNVPLGGPGLAEPPARMIAKEWGTPGARFYRLLDGRILVYSFKRRRWKAYRPQRPLVLYRNPRVRTLVKAAKRVDNLMLTFNRRLGKYRSRVRYGGPRRAGGRR